MKSVTHDLISLRHNELAGITGNSYYPPHMKLYGPRVMHINDAFFIYGTWGEPEDKFALHSSEETRIRANANRKTSVTQQPPARPRVDFHPTACGGSCESQLRRSERRATPPRLLLILALIKWNVFATAASPKAFDCTGGERCTKRAEAGPFQRKASAVVTYSLDDESTNMH